jgi:hypothetical protein
MDYVVFPSHAETLVRTPAEIPPRASPLPVETEVGSLHYSFGDDPGNRSFRSSFAVWGEDCVICVTDGHDAPTLPQLGADASGPGNAFVDDISSM